jgi:phosphatidylglycerol:prolipoprotein diacylglycerol transferase
MFPTLLSLGSLHIRTYGACMAAGFLLCWTLAERLSGRRDLGNFFVALMLSGVVGSRIAYVIEHWKGEFVSRPLDVVRVDQGGLMFYGGLILSVAVFFAWCLIKKERPLALADLLCTLVPLGHACGRIGCFFYGCCYGRVSDSPLAVTFPMHSPAWYEQVSGGQIAGTAARSLPVLPTQLFEAAALLALFAALLWAYLRWRRHTAGLYLVGYGVIRFGLEYLRGDPRAAVGPFSISQTISFATVALGAAFLAYGKLARHNR